MNLSFRLILFIWNFFRQSFFKLDSAFVVFIFIYVLMLLFKGDKRSFCMWRNNFILVVYIFCHVYVYFICAFFSIIIYLNMQNVWREMNKKKMINSVVGFKKNYLLNLLINKVVKINFILTMKNKSMVVYWVYCFVFMC